ncbi:hypothetical protein WL03_12000 [Burkholderia ubonensis]|uniref:hypothetical protein n=1 Tax=Burkholderia ubonensis TaxID=101571 RepID=UPI0007604061|nr:hypothetical protein [Burkholderia ubonensis]KVX18522.1 hypothetical protein WL03_12000 [Burkholderia ubonensis]
MATRGRPKGVETKVMHVRIPVTLHEQLEVLQFVTKKSTSEVVRELLDRYVLSHGDLLNAVAKTRSEANRVWSKAEAENWERAHLEAEEERLKLERGGSEDE